MTPPLDPQPAHPTPDSAVDTVVNALLRARREHRCVSAVDLGEVLTHIDQAYAVQAGVARALHWFDAAEPTYWKSGGPSRQATLTHAPLPPAGVWTSPAAASRWPFNMRGIEAEVALRLRAAVDARMAASIDERSADALIDAMTVSIEIVDSRWSEGMSAPALLRLADLQSHGALVLGDWVPWVRRDWAQQICRVSIGRAPMVERRGTHALGNPAFGLGDWLRHATAGGRTVASGTVVTTGTWVGVLDAAVGDRVLAVFDGIGAAEAEL